MPAPWRANLALDYHRHLNKCPATVRVGKLPAKGPTLVASAWGKNLDTPVAMEAFVRGVEAVTIRAFGTGGMGLA